ncbi:hypothetical protein LT493_02535 [Streptomyces tricolor]|nr:hypothetical protein [Streptomyces tricolor]
MNWPRNSASAPTPWKRSASAAPSPVGPCHLAVHTARLVAPPAPDPAEIPTTTCGPSRRSSPPLPAPSCPAAATSFTGSSADPTQPSEHPVAPPPPPPAVPASPAASLERIGPNGLIPAPGSSRVLESALLLALLTKEDLAPAAADLTRRYLKHTLDTDPPDALQCAFARAALGDALTGSTTVRDALASFDHFSTPRKLLTFQTLLTEITDGAHRRDLPADAFDAHGQQAWLQLQMLALKTITAPRAATSDDWSRLALALRPGPPWQANHLARLVALLALRKHPTHQPAVREALLRISAEQQPGGGLPFVTGMDVFASAVAGIALTRTRPLDPRLAATADALAARQNPDGGFGFTVGVTQSDVDDTSYTLEFPPRRGPRPAHPAPSPRPRSTSSPSATPTGLPHLRPRSPLRDRDDRRSRQRARAQPGTPSRCRTRRRLPPRSRPSRRTQLEPQRHQRPLPRHPGPRHPHPQRARPLRAAARAARQRAIRYLHGDPGARRRLGARTRRHQRPHQHRLRDRRPRRRTRVRRPRPAPGPRLPRWPRSSPMAATPAAPTRRDPGPCCTTSRPSPTSGSCSPSAPVAPGPAASEVLAAGPGRAVRGCSARSSAPSSGRRPSPRCSHAAAPGR